MWHSPACLSPAGSAGKQIPSSGRGPLDARPPRIAAHDRLASPGASCRHRPGRPGVRPRRREAGGALGLGPHPRLLPRDVEEPRRAAADARPASQPRDLPGPAPADGLDGEGHGPPARQGHGAGRARPGAARPDGAPYGGGGGVLARPDRRHLVAGLPVHRGDAYGRSGDDRSDGSRRGGGLRRLSARPCRSAPPATAGDPPGVSRRRAAAAGPPWGRRGGRGGARGGGATRNRVRDLAGVDDDRPARGPRRRRAPRARDPQRHEDQQRAVRHGVGRGDLRDRPRHRDARARPLRFRRHGAHVHGPDGRGRARSRTRSRRSRFPRGAGGRLPRVDGSPPHARRV